MAKGFYINKGENVEFINFKKVEDLIPDYDTEKLFSNVTICFNEEGTGDVISINDIEYSLPVLIKVKGKPSRRLVEELTEKLEVFESEEIYLDEDDFYEEYEESEDGEESYYDEY